MELYDKWLQKFDNSKGLSLNAINCAIETEQLEKAITWLNKARETGLDKSLKVAEIRIMRKKNQSEQCDRKIDEILNDYPQDIEVRLTIGKLLYNTGEPRKALQIFSEANKIDQLNKKAIANIITIGCELGEHEKIDQFMSGIEKNAKKIFLLKAR